jgi:hypothetical protein
MGPITFMLHKSPSLQLVPQPSPIKNLSFFLPASSSLVPVVAISGQQTRPTRPPLCSPAPRIPGSQEPRRTFPSSSFLLPDSPRQPPATPRRPWERRPPPARMSRSRLPPPPSPSRCSTPPTRALPLPPMCCRTYSSRRAPPSTCSDPRPRPTSMSSSCASAPPSPPTSSATEKALTPGG